MSRLISIIALSWFLVGFAEHAVAYETPVCNINPYGAPEFEDCAHLLAIFTNSQDVTLRIFDEEQLRADRDGSWPGIVNPFSEGVVQVPRFWTKSWLNVSDGWTMADMAIDTCNLGLMSFASLTSLVSNMTKSLRNETAQNLGGARSAVGATRWSEIRYRATWLVNKCMIESKIGGFTVLTSGMIIAIHFDFPT